jgi:hypothetical protein
MGEGVAQMGVKTPIHSHAGRRGNAVQSSRTCTHSMSSTTAPTAAPATSPIRVFGRFQLRHLLGKSLVSMAWLAFDPRSQQEVMLTLPRHQPTSTAALDNWLRDVRQASRLSHPHLAAAAEVGEHERWPYVAVDRAIGITLGEWLAGKSLPPLLDTTGMLCQLLDGLAFAHEAGVAHNDIQLHSVIVGEQGVVRLMGLHVANEWVQAAAAPGAPAPVRRQQREHAERDVLSVGLLLHRVVSGQLVLDEVDIGKVIQRMPPQGHEVVRLPWGLPLPVAEPLRAIANRATASHDRQRYLSPGAAARPAALGRPSACLTHRGRTHGPSRWHGKPAHRRDRRKHFARHGAEL